MGRKSSNIATCISPKALISISRQDFWVLIVSDLFTSKTEEYHGDTIIEAIQFSEISNFDSETQVSDSNNKTCWMHESDSAHLVPHEKVAHRIEQRGQQIFLVIQVAKALTCWFPFNDERLVPPGHWWRASDF